MTRLLLLANLLALIIFTPFAVDAYNDINRPMEQGLVVSRAYDEPYTQKYDEPKWECIMIRWGERDCDFAGYIPREIHRPARYWLRIEELDGRQRVVEVDVDTYHHNEEGTWFDGEIR